MREIICGICGTQYPDTDKNCPLCGTPRNYRTVISGDDAPAQVSVKEQAAAEKKKQIFDFDEVNPRDEQDTADEEDYEEAYDETESNTGLVVGLVILITLLLLAVGFLLFRFILPNIGGEKDTAPSAATIPQETLLPATEETEPEETGEPTIPCTDLSIPGGKVELAQKGQFWLLNVQVFPQNTTDVLTFSSEDDTIATVDEDGKVTAVGEGKTVIHILCGDVKLKCTVTVDFSLESENAEEEILPTLSVEEDEEGNTETTEATESTEAAATEETSSGELVLKLKKTDITMNSRYSSVQLELDCDIPADEIQWLTMDSTKAIVNNGLVTATGPGTTTIKAMYKGQVAECIVRCNFS